MDWTKVQQKFQHEDDLVAQRQENRLKAIMYLHQMVDVAVNHLNLLSRMDQQLVLCHSLDQHGTAGKASWLTLLPSGMLCRYRPIGTDNASQAYSKSSHITTAVSLTELENEFAFFGLSLEQLKQIELKEEERLSAQYPQHFMRFHAPQ